MTHTHLYSIEDVRKTYEKIHDHRRTSEVIKNHSLNKDDIRGIALEGMDLSKITEVLDLGCGYGFFTEALKERLPANTRITGVDIIDAHNRASFLDTVSAFGYSGEFVHMDAGAFIHETPGSSFDLIIASYSLYFFAHLIKEIARVLRPGGIFLALTHTRDSLDEVVSLIPKSMESIGIDPPRETRIQSLFNAFCLEDGESQLRPYFNEVERIIYKNALSFDPDTINACIDYLKKKSYLLFKDVRDHSPSKIHEMEDAFFSSIRGLAQRQGQFSIIKDDAVFRCRTF